MIKLLFIFIFGFLVHSSFAQSVDEEQQKAIQVEQQKLKEGKISYEEYQKRYDKIIASSKAESKENKTTQTVDVKRDSTLTKVATKDSTVVIKQESTPAETKKEVVDLSNSTTSPSPVVVNKTPDNFSMQVKPGDELIKFTRVAYAGIAATIVSTGIMTLGTFVSLITMGQSGTGLFLLGGAGIVAGSLYALSSINHIKKAGQLLNIQQQNPR